MPTNHFGRLTLIGIIFLGAVACIFPWLVSHPVKLFDPSINISEKLNLKPGIDMVGGTSLLYEIKPPEGGYTPDLATRVMEALKKRIDPEGLKNLVWRPQGTNKLEIQMPRVSTSEGAQKIRAQLADATSALEGTNVSPLAVIDATQRLKGAERAERIRSLAMDSEARKAIFAGMAEAADKVVAARARQDAAAQGAAETAFDTLKAKIAKTDVDVKELTDRLEVVEQAKEKQAEDPKAPAPPAEIVAQIDAMRDAARDFPAQAAAFDQYVAAYKAFFPVRDQLDDAAALKRKLKGSGVLEFHIVVDPGDARVPEMTQRLDSGQGTSPRSGDTSRWAQIDKPKDFHANSGYVIRPYAGHDWMLLDNRPDKCLTQQTGQWALTGASPQQDQQTGDTHVAFTFDIRGGIYMGRLTGGNVNRCMAIVLDNRVISAPNIQSQISDRGQITGKYSADDIDYLTSTLNAGSLPAQLADEPISERSIGSSVGDDNLRSGFLACGVGLIVVFVFFACYYYLSGLVAFVAVIMNLVLILGALAAFNATFTLPGVAALILTLGTAVDANVLIFERLREEQHRGFPLRTALRNAYDRAFSAIVDSNTVTAIVSLVLYLLGSEEVKGFGLTLLIGIAASLFTALFVTKTIFAILIDVFGVKSLGSFPQTFPAWDRMLKPHFDWMGKIRILGAVSLVILVAGLGLFGHYVVKGEMMDIEFASGTAVTIDLKEPTPIEKVRSDLAEADARDVLVTSGATQRTVKIADAIPAPTVVPVGGKGLSYEIVTPSSDVPAVRAAIMATFQEALDIRIPSSFDKVGSPFDSVDGTTVVLVGNAPPQGRFAPEKWGEYRGGVAIYLDNISPPMTPREMQDAINAERLLSGSGGQNLPPAIVLAPTGANVKTSEAVVLSVDTRISGEEDREKWHLDVAEPLWKLVGEAIHQPPKLTKVSNFNAQVASGFKQDATMAIALSLVIIMAYVWLRFGTLKYGWANTVALLHDTLFIIAAIGYAHLLCAVAPALSRDLLIEPFRINLTVVAGILTIMGYSMVDTIVVFDRIREIRGPRGSLSRKVINDAINQTLSRTLLTAGTTVATLFVMYIFGGAGIHGFTYVLLIGILVGTYSSVVIAAPMLLIGLGKQARAKPPAESSTQLSKA